MRDQHGINNNMNDKEPEVEKKPDDVGGFLYSSFIKITDPDTEEVLVETRGD